MNVTVETPSGPLIIPIPLIDALAAASTSTTINYAVQIGFCSLMLLVTLLTSNLHKPTAALHMLTLVLCIIRTSLLLCYFLSPFVGFYATWAGDYSSIPPSAVNASIASIASNVFSLLVVASINVSLFHQAWTMIRLWSATLKLAMASISATVALLSVGWHFAFSIVQSQATAAFESAARFHWLMQATLVLNVVSVCWFCALFNAKLVGHILANRGILSKSTTFSPMEVLVMTNGILMVVPVIFAGLEWGRFTNFEAASVSQSSVAIVLPLGSLVAQQMTTTPGSLAALSSAMSNSSMTQANGSKGQELAHKFPSFSTTGASTLRHPSVSSPSGSSDRPKPSHYDLELLRIDSTGTDDHIRLDTDLEQTDART